LIPYPEIPEVRIQHISVNAGGVFISLPYKVGDKVWAIVSERDVASLMSLNRVSTSTTATHDLSDCFCIPSFATDVDGLETDPDNIVIANKSTKIVVKEDGVYIDTQEYQLNASSATIDATDTKVMGKVGFNGKEPVTLPIVSGSRAGNAALALLLTQLQNYGLIIDTTTP
jgi:selenophosphate synthetase-related protein